MAIMPMSSQAPFRTPASTTLISQMQKIHAEAKRSLEKAADQMKAQYDEKKHPTIKYQVGDKVWLDTTNLNLLRTKKKLADKQTGPFEIVSKKGASAYTLKLPTNWHIHPMFNEALLTPYTPPAFPNQEQPPPPPPDLIDGAEHYEVEKVLNSRECKVRGKAGEPWHWVTDYFIEWKRYGPESNSWVREDNMDTEELIDKYLTEHVDMVNTRKPNWQFHLNPRTGKKMWYNDWYGEDKDWDWLGGHNDPSMDTKSPFEPTSIP